MREKEERVGVSMGGSRSKIRQAPAGAETSRCRKCGRYYEVADSVQRFANMADNPLLVKNVIQAMASEYSPDAPEMLSKRVCDLCAQGRCENVLDKNSWNDPNGYNILNETEEQYGRFADTSGGTVVARRGTKEKERVVTDTQETGWETETPMSDQEAAGQGQPDPSIGTPRQGPTRAERLAEEWPVGQLGQFVKTEWKGAYGRVLGLEDKRGVAYTKVAVETFASGKRREGDQVKEVLVREGSFVKVDAYPDPPAEKTTPAAAETSEDTTSE
jgi:hypothetical protein